MPNWRRQFKILTHVPVPISWVHSFPGVSQCPEYVVYSWCPKRKRFRLKQTLAIGVPYYSSWCWKRRCFETETTHHVYGQQLADQHGIPWVKTFDPSWKLHDLMLMRLKGKV